MLSSLLPQSSQLFAVVVVVVHCSKFALDVALDSVAPHVDLAASTSSRVLLLRPINGFRTSRLPTSTLHLEFGTATRACAHVDDLSPSSFFFFCLAVCCWRSAPFSAAPRLHTNTIAASVVVASLVVVSHLCCRGRAYYDPLAPTTTCVSSRLGFASPRTIRTT